MEYDTENLQFNFDMGSDELSDATDTLAKKLDLNNSDEVIGSLTKEEIHEVAHSLLRARDYFDLVGKKLFQLGLITSGDDEEVAEKA